MTNPTISQASFILQVSIAAISLKLVDQSKSLPGAPSILLASPQILTHLHRLGADIRCHRRIAISQTPITLHLSTRSEPDQRFPAATMSSSHSTPSKAAAAKAGSRSKASSSRSSSRIFTPAMRDRQARNKDPYSSSEESSDSAWEGQSRKFDVYELILFYLHYELFSI